MSALRRKQAISSLRHSQPPPPSRRTSSPDTYVLEWSPHARHRHALPTAEEIRSEILAGDDSNLGVRRLLVVRGDPVGDIGAVLRDVAGVDGAFLRAHEDRRVFRCRGRGRAWCWGVPERVPRKGGVYGRAGQDTVIGRASLWLSSSLPILLISKPPPVVSAPTPTPPTLRHQDAATGPFSLHPSGLYGALGIHVPEEGDSSRLEDGLWDTLDSTTSVADTLGELVHERWVTFVDGLKPRRSASRHEECLLWSAMKALEQNLDTARDRYRHGSELESIRVEDWSDLIERVQRRIQLYASSQPTLSSSGNGARPMLPDGTPLPPDKDINERSLDRIAYLGGILLPVTVVSGVLSIEGDYGPEGGNFWVFWVASLAMSVLALMVIYVDQVRSLEVWIEVAAEAAGDAVDAMDAMFDTDESEVEERRDGDMSDRSTTYLVKRDGLRARTWQRKRLGWGGAVKRITGYDRLRGVRGVEVKRERGESRV